MTVIDEARRHAAVDALYRQVEAITPITVEFVDGPSWGSLTLDGATTIEAGTASNPAAALYHELLHADLKNAGYRQHSLLLAANAAAKAAQELLAPLDNELQHHRMFPRFSAAGFADDAFYGDDDTASFAWVRQQLAGVSDQMPVGHILMLLLTVIAPGGHGSAEERAELRGAILDQAGPPKAAILAAVEDHIAAWAISDQADPRETLRAIFVELGGYGGGWVGVTEAFPDDGFFTGRAFSMETALAYLQGGG